MTEALRIAVAGLGTVGAGTLQLIREHSDLISARCGRPIMVSAVSARDRRKNRPIDLSGVRWFEDPIAMAADPEVDVVMEMIGGAEGIAKDTIENAIRARHHVITANKALLAHHGAALAREAEAAGVTIGYEAAVCGGVPVIKGLREGLAGNSLSRIYGILNGTCNFILSTMRETGREFGEVLAERRSSAMPRRTPASTSTAWTLRTSWRS